MATNIAGNLIWIGVITLILAAAVIAAVVIVITRSKKPESFQKLEDELTGAGGAQSLLSDGAKAGSLADIKGGDESHTLDLQNSKAGKTSRHSAGRYVDDDVKTRNIFADRNIGLFSYYIELQDIKTGEKYTTGIADSIRIGRKPDCNIIINSGTVSNYHCQIHMQGGNLVLRDLQSLNGSYINGMRVYGDMRLPTGVILRLGQKEFLVTVCDFRDPPEDL